MRRSFLPILAGGYTVQCVSPIIHCMMCKTREKKCPNMTSICPTVYEYSSRLASCLALALSLFPGTLASQLTSYEVAFASWMREICVESLGVFASSQL